MSQFGITLSNALLNFIFNSVDPTPNGAALSANLGAAAMSTPSATAAFYVSLHKMYPPASTSQNQQEPTQAEYPGYARVTLNRGTIGTPGTSWSVANRNAASNVALTWPAVGSGAPGNVTVTHVGFGNRNLPLSATMFAILPIMPVGEPIRAMHCIANSSAVGGHRILCPAHGYVDGDTVALYGQYFSNIPPSGAGSIGVVRYIKKIDNDVFQLFNDVGLNFETSVPVVDSGIVAKIAPVIIADGVTPTVLVTNANIRQV